MSSLPWIQHLILAPILLPLLAGAVLIPVNAKRHGLKFAIDLGCHLLLLAAALVLFWQTDQELWPGSMGVYLAANWMAPFGIALVADRLSTLMLVLTAVLSLAALIFSHHGWSRIGAHFHSLFLFLLMGINGAFLTHDLFNLFVFFEVMLAASYGLVLHGYNTARIRAGMQYIAINLAASLLFLIGIALIYACTGTLNMADLGPRIAVLAPEDLPLLQIGALILALAFLTKGAMWPLGFWLPTTYAAASPPVAAMLVLMTKVGLYAIIRLWPLAFADGPLAGFGLEALFWGGMATLLFGTLGTLAAQEPGRMAGYAAIISSGTLMAIIGSNQPGLLGAGLYYLLGSTLAIAAFLLLIGLIERIRTPGTALLALTMEAFAIEEKPEEPVGVGIPAALAFLGLAFAGSALVITGLPPLSGFIAKFSLFHALLNGSSTVPLQNGGLILLIFCSGLAGIIALMRFGVRTFWASGNIQPPSLQHSEALPISLLLLLCIAMTIYAGPLFDYLGRVSQDLAQPEHYVEGVLSAPVIAAPAGARP
ncbi:MAG: monovalent cation/H+ antiporter subunit D [Azovibrio sp.]|uniref:monovalent cation/H+ antiporter subunit D n=1 Tax=Azovibrio sp. TaxID=1872673 RepID=UPI003C729E3F